MCSHSHEHHCCGHTHAQNHILHGKNNILSIYKAEILSALLLVVTLIIEHCGVLRRISEAAGCAVSIPEIILYAVALIPVGLPILRESWEMWRKGRGGCRCVHNRGISRGGGGAALLFIR